MKELADGDLARLIGGEVARLRRRTGLSMRELGSRAGMSQPFLSQVERGESLPSMTSVYRLARALDVAPGELLPAPRPSATVVRSDEGQRLPITESSTYTGIRALLLADGVPLTVLEYTINASERIEEWYQTAGDSGLLVFEGSVVVELRSGEEYRLGAGDFIHLAAGIFDRWRLAEGDQAKVLFVISTPDGTAPLGPPAAGAEGVERQPGA